ncbi:hypothetical protein [Qipengyuania sp. DGS5-3]|uniref:FliH/SctL family protein n=1 Tax=Qipengyuania sp. DGS5-3 TaxID=3349632 RepID=UPI0036D43608
MSAFMLCGDAMLRLPSARIAREDVATFRQSAQLLAETKALKENAAIAAREAERRGYERGRDQALEEMRGVLSEALAQLTSDFAAENARRERDVASAAMHVVEQTISRTDDAEVISGLARGALRHSGSSPDGEAVTGETRVQVAPQWAASVAHSLADNPEVLVEADPELAGMGCRVVSGEGRIIADLDTQLAALRERWGLDKPEHSESGNADG